MAETWKTIVSKLTENVSVLLIVLGFVLLILGLAGGITYHDWLPIKQNQPRAMAGLLGATIMALGIFRDGTKSKIPTADKCGIEITLPLAGDRVPERTTVRGTIKRLPPVGYAIQVLRFNDATGYVPVGEVRLLTDKKNWEANNCSTGGSSGDERWFAVYLVGLGGAELLKYQKAASAAHRDTREQLAKFTNKTEPHLPLIRGVTPDMVECYRVKVYRA